MKPSSPLEDSLNESGNLIPEAAEQVGLPFDMVTLTALVRRLVPPRKPVSTIDEFCKDHKITKPHYYTLKKQGKGPREMKVGRRRFVTDEAAADWRRDREQDTEEGDK